MSRETKQAVAAPDVSAMTTADVPAGRATAKPAARTKAPAAVWISWVALAMMTTSSVASLRAAPTMAVYGLACVFLYIVGAARRLATELVVIMASATHEIQTAAGAFVRAAALAVARPAGTSAVVMADTSCATIAWLVSRDNP